jgi:hypothetical protein
MCREKIFIQMLTADVNESLCSCFTLSYTGIWLEIRFVKHRAHAIISSSKELSTSTLTLHCISSFHPHALI